jgi:hypothetical protein
MDNYGLTMKGQFVIEAVSTLPTWQESDIGRLIFVSATNKFYNGSDTDWVDFGGITTVATLPVWTLSDQGKIIYDLETNAFHFGGDTKWTETGSVVELRQTLISTGEFSGIILPATAGETVTVCSLVYLDTNSKWKLANASTISKSFQQLGISLDAGNLNDSIRILLSGNVKGFVGLTVGYPAYVGLSDGTISMTAPSATNQVVRIVGYCLGASELYFNPSQDYIEVL